MLASHAMRQLRTVLALGAFFVSMAVLAACGGVSGSSVATVGDSQITQSTFDHWLAVVARSNAAQAGGGKVTIPDPPGYPKCIAALRTLNAKSAPKNAPKQSEKQYKGICKSQYEQYRDQAMNFLIQGQWVQGEAKDQGISLSEKELQASFQKQKKQAFRKEKDFQKFLKSSGMTVDDLLFRVKVDTLANRLKAKANKTVKKVTQADVAAYYAKHKSQFGTPEQRTLRIVLTRKRGKAEQALKALRSGQSFKKVAKTDSIDGRTKNSGGLLPNVRKGQEEAQLEKAAFAAPKGKLVGPVKAPFGFYILRVEKIKPAKQDPLAKSAPSIRQQLTAQRQNDALQTFIKRFRKKWTSRTDCKAAFKVEGCKGFKKKPTPTPTQTPTPTPTPTPPGAGRTPTPTPTPTPPPKTGR